MRLLGTNIYVWDGVEQSRLLLDAVLPVVAELHQSGRLERFVFDRFDARGPHLFVVVGVPDADAEATRQRLDEAIRRYLDEHPPTAAFDDETIAERHAACRGKALCDADFGDDVAALGESVAFEATDADYPFFLTKTLPDAAQLWHRVASLPIWALEQVQARPQQPALPAALCWLAALDHHLGERGFDRRVYYRHHASTLVMVLPQRLEAEPEAEVLASVSKAVSAKNRQVFDSVWRLPVTPESAWPGLPELADQITSWESDRVARAVVRELVHTTFKQLGVPVSLHVPIMLYGWGRHSETVEVAS